MFRYLFYVAGVCVQLKNRNYLTITIKIQFISGDMAHKTHRRYREIDRNTENTIKTGNRSHHSINTVLVFFALFMLELTLLTPRHRLSTYGRRAFAVAGSMTFNALPDELRDPTGQHNNFQTTFKDTFFLELSTRLAH